jgi:hypothetical protein
VLAAKPDEVSVTDLDLLPVENEDDPDIMM